jgi:hypothetical protein
MDRKRDKKERKKKHKRDKAEKKKHEKKHKKHKSERKSASPSINFSDRLPVEVVSTLPSILQSNVPSNSIQHLERDERSRDRKIGSECTAEILESQVPAKADDESVCEQVKRQPLSQVGCLFPRVVELAGRK